MPKFSIIIPVYNLENYIETCLESIMHQTNQDMEVLVVDDGSTDHSVEKIKKYPVHLIELEKEGYGNGHARNVAVKEAKGEYILFVDGDDTIEPDLLETLVSVPNDPDLIRYQIRKVYEDGRKEDLQEVSFEDKNGVEAFSIISTFHIVESPCCYAVKRAFYQEGQFRFQENAYHEDFGLIPYIIIKAKKVTSITKIGYNYLQRTGSIMHHSTYEQAKKKVYDMYGRYQDLMRQAKKETVDTSIYRSFLANSMILKITELKGKDYREMKKKLKEEHVFDEIQTNTLPRKVKKQILKWSPKLYYRLRG